jgi:hypothetical protein
MEMTISQNGSKQQMNTLSKPATSWNVNAAMRDIYDIGERIQLWPIMLGQVAKQIHDNPDSLFDLKVTEIEWMIPYKNLTAEVKSLFNTWGFKENERGYEYSFEGIPVYIRVIKRKYAFFEKPDQKFYKVDDFMLPNPFNAYWRIHNLVR